jgi:AGCS family alanine or glycine:cation symporter
MIDALKEGITLALIFPVVILVGSYLSIKLRFIQVTHLIEAVRMLSRRGTKGEFSSFAALSAILGGNLGTGNISGVAVALLTGGPGAIFWMWIMAILASVTKYVGCFLGVHFQRQNARGEWVGGPMYYLAEGLNAKKLALLYCFFTVTSAFTVGNLAQVHALAIPLHEVNIHPLFLSLPLAILVGGVLFGSLRFFSKLVSGLVPLMAFLYLATCFYVLFAFRHNIIPSLEAILANAFGFDSALGGLFGFSVLAGIRAGFDRGLFATDCGLGLAPIVHASVHDKSTAFDNRVKQGLISIISPLIVMLVCTTTALVLLSTGAFAKSNLLSTAMCMEAFRIGFASAWAGQIVSVTLFFFAFTTILTWSFCAERAVEFALGERFLTPFKILFILVIPLGAFMHDAFVWHIADLSINFMFLINMIGVLGLSRMTFKKPS